MSEYLMEPAELPPTAKRGRKRDSEKIEVRRAQLMANPGQWFVYESGASRPQKANNIAIMLNKKGYDEPVRRKEWPIKVKVRKNPDGTFTIYTAYLSGGE